VRVCIQVGGGQGAKHIADELSRRGVQLEFLLDEGLFVIDGVVPGHVAPVAMICVAEKGMVTLKLTTSCDPGHASMPPKEGAVGILARALDKLERHPFPAHMSAAGPLFSALRGGFRWPMQLIMSNLWLFAPLLKLVLASKPKTATLVRTTTALTVVRSGEKSNVLPSTATALVNHRIHPADTVASVVARDTRIINDPRVSVQVLQHKGEDLAREASPVSSIDHDAFRTLVECVKVIFPHATPAPGLFVAASDSKHFWGLASQIYRFNPIALTAEETSMFHGFNERISIEGHATSVAWFRELHVRSNQRVPRASE